MSSKLQTLLLHSSWNKKISYINVHGTKPLVETTVGDLVRSAPDRFGDRLAIIDRHRGIRKTHAEFQNDVRYYLLSKLIICMYVIATNVSN